MLPIIEVNHISKKYRIGEKQRYYSFRDTLTDLASSPFKQKQKKNEFWALKDVSFKVMPGEVVGIIGRNGAGKSTLLKILSRITLPTKGEITLRGRVASLLEVGTGFHPELTGRENIYLNGAILGMKRAEISKKFDEIVEFSEISKFLDTPVKFYSSGMYMRLAFAIAAHLEPEILLVDEVLAVGDVQFQKKCLGKMGEVAKAGRTILFVSHNMAAVRNLCTRAILLDKGKIEYIGETKNTVKRYLEHSDKDSVRHTTLEWKAYQANPFSEIIQIRRFYIEDKNGKIAKPKLFNSGTYRAVVEADFVKSDASLIVAVILYDDEHNVIFVSNMCDTGEIDFSRTKPGKIRLSVPIPVDILANKTYEIELACSLSKIAWIYKSNNETRLRFDFVKDVDPNPYFNSGANGLIAPILPWRLDRV